LAKLENHLDPILGELGLSYVDVANLSRLHLPISAKTIADLAKGRRLGNLRSWARIRDGLNTHVGSTKYAIEDIIGQAYESYATKWKPRRRRA